MILFDLGLEAGAYEDGEEEGKRRMRGREEGTRVGVHEGEMDDGARGEE